MARICALIEERTGVSYHRIEIPVASFNDTHKDEFKMMIANGFTLQHPPDYDIIWLNRVSGKAETFTYMKQAKANGTKIVLDFDDWIELPKDHGHNHGMFTPIIQEQIRRTIDLADVIWAASECLRDELLKLYPSKEIIYIPNAIDFSQPQFIPVPRKQQRYTIGWIGGTSHQHDLEKLLMPLKKLLPSKDYNIMLGGYSKTSPEYWDYVCSLLSSMGKLPDGRFLKVEALDCYNYAFMYNLLDLSLAPLCDDIYSRCKSNIKVLEAGAFNLPIICSWVDPYMEFISQGLAYQGVEWTGRIQHLIKNPAAGIKMGETLGKYVREHYDIRVVNKLRYESIKKLIA